MHFVTLLRLFTSEIQLVLQLNNLGSLHLPAAIFSKIITLPWGMFSAIFPIDSSTMYHMDIGQNYKAHICLPNSTVWSLIKFASVVVGLVAWGSFHKSSHTMLVIVFNLLHLSSKSTYHCKKGSKAFKCFSFVSWQGIKLCQYRVIEINTGTCIHGSDFFFFFCKLLQHIRLYQGPLLQCGTVSYYQPLPHRQPPQCSVSIVHSSQIHPVTSSFPGSPLQQFHRVTLLWRYLLWQPRG